MKSQRGQSLSLFVAVVVAALLLMAGLVVDGGRQAAAARGAELAASAAARAAANETATAQVAGRRPDLNAAVAAAHRSLAATPGVEGTVILLPNSRIRVSTRTSVETVFLELVGVGRLEAMGVAEAALYSG